MATNPSQGLPLICIENTGAAQTNVPFTFGQVFKVGALKPGAGLAAQIESGTIPLQVDYKATHGDGSVRHAVVSGLLSNLAAGATVALQLVEAKAVASKALSPAMMPDGAVEITIDGVKYSTNGSKFCSVTEWLSGPVVAEGIISADLLGPDGKAHPHLTVRAGVRAYSSKHVRVEMVIENTKTFTPGAQNFTYDVAAKVGGVSAFEQKGLVHYHHARWRKVFWVGETPAIHIKHDIAYLIETRAISNYDQTVKPAEKELANYAKALTESNTAPMAIGLLAKSMGTSGGRPDIGPLPMWTVSYLLSLDPRAQAAMNSVAEGAASWSIHYRDENTGFPVRTDSTENAKISTHMNLKGRGPLPVPRFAAGKPYSTPYKHDTAHQPSMSYVPYLLTGDYYHLEELQFWATSNTMETDPNNAGNGLGLVRWQQLRGQAWSLRTMGHAAYITPDSHPLKDYFNKQVDNNLDYYSQVFVEKNPNNLGAYDGTGPGMERKDESSPWQDDFFTWSLGHLTELGFVKAEPIFRWKAKFSIGRMTGPGYCWVHGATYYLKFRDSVAGPVYEDFAKLYQANFANKPFWLEDKHVTHPQRLSYIDQPCGSQEQADWLSAAHGRRWPVGQMAGYASSILGYPSNMQPALALVASSGVENGKEAWAKFDARSTKPDYKLGAQWAIIPRPLEPEVEAPPAKRLVEAFEVVAETDGTIILSDSSIVAGATYTIIVLKENK